MRHVSGGVNVDQHADTGDKQQPDAGKRIEQESGVGLKRSLRAVVLHIIQVAGVSAKPGVKNFFERLVIVRRSPLRILQHCSARYDERQHHGPHADSIHRRLLQPAPKEKHECRADGGKQRDEIDVI